FAARSRAEWCATLEQLEVPHSPVYSAPEVVETPQAQHLGLTVEDPDGPHGRFRTIRSPVSFDGERATSVTAPPVLGQHNEEVLGLADTSAAAE
ncbi:MAG: CoA transferase, partial [Blastomonas fulva]